MVYAGVDGSAIPEGAPLHHQVVLGEPFGEGNTVFLSLSPTWDTSRAPAGRRTLTMSTHTALDPWWKLFDGDRKAYEARKEMYVDRLFGAAELVFPSLREASDLVLPGTPVSFQRSSARNL